MEPISEITDHLFNYWCNDEPQRALFTAPEGMDGCASCSAVVTQKEGLVVRVPWKPSDADLWDLMAGGTIWLSQWGGLAPHMLEVQGVTPPGPFDKPLFPPFEKAEDESPPVDLPEWHEKDCGVCGGFPHWSTACEEMPEDFEIALDPTTPDMADA